MEVRHALIVEVALARLIALPMVHTVVGLDELGRVPERVHDVHGLHERVLVVERRLHLEPLDAAGVFLQLPDLDGLELVAGHRRPAREIGGVEVLRVQDELVAVPESDRVAVPGVRAVQVAVLLAEQHAPDRRPEVVDQVRLLRQVDELVRVGLEQEPRQAGRLAVAEPVVVDLAFLGLLPPAFLVGFLVRGRQHAFDHLAVEVAGRDERAQMRVAGRDPESVPARHGRERLLRAALRLLEQIFVMLLGRSELLRRRNHFERRTIARAEAAVLRGRERRRG